MADFNPFSHIPPGALLYFHYGLAFIFLGAAIAFKDMRGSRLHLAPSLYYLAAFGFSHGTREWLELYFLVTQQVLSGPEIIFVKGLGFVSGSFSYLSLLLFGMILLRQTCEERNDSRLCRLPVVIIFIWLIALCILWFSVHRLDRAFILHAEHITRYSLAFTSSMVAGLALILYSRTIQELSMTTAKNLRRAGIVFGVYGVLAGFFPSKYILPLLHVPVELLRMIAAVFMTGFMVNGLNIFNIETRRQLIDQIRGGGQTEKLAALGRLAAGIAHEINNPLTNSSLSLQMIRRKLIRAEHPDSTLIDKIDAAARNIERASVIAAELLQFSRNDEPVFRPLDINEVISLSLVAVEYRLAGTRVIKKLGEVGPVVGDQCKLQQVIINILNNAVEAMVGRPVKEISINTSCSQDKVRVEITDSGIGMNEAMLARSFDPFFTTKEVGLGTGLGLSLCYGIIKQHKGDIMISSDSGMGSTVIIELPQGLREHPAVDT